MFRKCLLILSLFWLVPVQAGELEDAFAKNSNVFLYMYTPQCSYCTQFAPRYNKISKMYEGQYAFLKLDANTSYGRKVFRAYKGMYVPYVLLLNNKKSLGVQLAPSCLMDTACVDKELKNFLKSGK